MFDLREYLIAEMRFVGTAKEWLMTRRDGVYAQIKRVSYSDGIPTSQNTLSDGQIVRSETLKHEQAFTFDLANVEKGDLESLVAEIDRAADETLTHVMGHLFGHIGKIAEATGNNINAQGRTFSFDLYLEMLEKMEIQFDADGNARLPTLAVTPDQAAALQQLPPLSPEQQAAADAIIQRKREVALAKRRHRTLSGRGE